VSLSGRTTWRLSAAILINLGLLLATAGPLPPKGLWVPLALVYLPHIRVAAAADGALRVLWPSVPFVVAATALWLTVLPVSYLYVWLVATVLRQFRTTESN